MKIQATKVSAVDLKPGDLFSTAGPEYWDCFPQFFSIGERVYIRTNVPADIAFDADAEVHRIEIVKAVSPLALWLGIGAFHRLRCLRSLEVPEPENCVDLAWNALPEYIRQAFAGFVATDIEIQRQFGIQ